MIRMRSILDIADNTGAKRASCIGVIGRHGRALAEVGDIVTANIKEASPGGIVKAGEVVKGVVVRTVYPLRRPDGSYL
jgi:large subunit ribosomal protein L14